MEIKRKIEISIATNRRYSIRQSVSAGKISCVECSETMLTTEQAANLFSITQRRIFQIIETNAACYAEIESGATMTCITSLAKFLDERIRH